MMIVYLNFNGGNIKMWQWLITNIRQCSTKLQCINPNNIPITNDLDYENFDPLTIYNSYPKKTGKSRYKKPSQKPNSAQAHALLQTHISNWNSAVPTLKLPIAGQFLYRLKV